MCKKEERELVDGLVYHKCTNGKHYFQDKISPKQCKQCLNWQQQRLTISQKTQLVLLRNTL